MYIWQLPNWPRFTWDIQILLPYLNRFYLEQGKLFGRIGTFGLALQNESTLKALTQEIIKNSQIENEILNENEVRSSIARKLCLDIGGLIPSSRNVDGFVEMVLDATQNYSEPLSSHRLCEWHTLLFAGSDRSNSKIIIGNFRDDAQGPMQVVSGIIKIPRVHFEAPPAHELINLIEIFCSSFNDIKPENDLVLMSGVFHLWFLTLHPFDDGNGRIARALSDLLLTRSDNGAQRFYSLSWQIEKDRENYYDILEKTQKGDLDITQWLQWYLQSIAKATANADVLLNDIQLKSNFWNKWKALSFNQRQIRILQLLLDDFKGKLTTTKYAKLARCSQDTAYRDISDLIEKGILTKDAKGGRSTAYLLTEIND